MIARLQMQPGDFFVHIIILTLGCRDGLLENICKMLPAIIKIACGAASEEASCIPLPPRRRKLHIRWLLLPFQTVTAALGHSLG